VSVGQWLGDFMKKSDKEKVDLERAAAAGEAESELRAIFGDNHL